jgi:hypothetical protein
MPRFITMSVAAMIVCAATSTALATHDGGTRYLVLRVSDAGAALVSECDVQMGQQPTLRVVSAKGRTLATVALEGDVMDDATMSLCSDAATASATLPGIDGVPALLERYDLEHTPVVADWSPQRHAHLYVAVKGTRADVALLGPRARPLSRHTVRAKRGMTPAPIDLQVAWHPAGTWALLYGSLSDGIAPSVQLWEPYMKTFAAPPPLRAEDVARRYVDDAAPFVKGCRREPTGDACTTARDLLRSALREVPDYAPAVEALATMER